MVIEEFRKPRKPFDKVAVSKGIVRVHQADSFNVNHD